MRRRRVGTQPNPPTSPDSRATVPRYARVPRSAARPRASGSGYNMRNPRYGRAIRGRSSDLRFAKGDGGERGVGLRGGHRHRDRILNVTVTFNA